MILFFYIHIRHGFITLCQVIESYLYKYRKKLEKFLFSMTKPDSCQPEWKQVFLKVIGLKDKHFLGIYLV